MCFIATDQSWSFLFFDLFCFFRLTKDTSIFVFRTAVGEISEKPKLSKKKYFQFRINICI